MLINDDSDVDTFVIDLGENDLEEFSALTNSMDDGEVPAGVAVWCQYVIFCVCISLYNLLRKCYR